MNTLKTKFKSFTETIFTKESFIRFLFFLIPIISIVLKGIFYQGFVTSGNPYTFDFFAGNSAVSSVSLSYYIAFAVFFMSFSLLFKGKGRIIYVFIVDIIVTALFILDIWYYRGFNTVPSLLIATQTSNLDNLGEAIGSMISSFDFLFILDFIVLGIYVFFTKSYFAKTFKKAIGGFLVTFIISFVYIAYLPFNMYVLKNSNVTNSYILANTDPNYTHKYLSTIGYHIFDAITVYYDTQPYTLTEEDKADIDEYFSFKNENLPDNEYFGAAKGKNVIYIQVESLESFVINQKINGQEITPNLNKLVTESLYFPNTFEQVNEGTSADCDFIMNTSLFPVRRGTTFFRYPNNDYNSLPKILANNDYSTQVIHPDKGSFWNYEIALSGGIGFQKFTDYYSFNDDESIGMGLSDRTYFTQVTPMIKAMEENSPFYAMTITLTSHGPFNLPQEYRELTLDSELDENKLGGYFQSIHYTDAQIGMFIEKLKEEGVLDNSIIVLMGDHTGVHKYYNDDIEKLSTTEDWWLDEGGRRVPMLIYDPSGNVKSKSFDSLIGGQVDTMPTLLYLLGIPSEQYENTAMGRNLLNTTRSYAVINNGKIYGEETLTDEEKNILSKSLDISDKIIRSNYTGN